MNSRTTHSEGQSHDPHPISVVILTYNEEVNIRHALDSVTWCDDVIIVDSFSTDRTEAICLEYPNVRFIQNRFSSLASQRQFAMDSGLIRHPWVLALDADEIVPEALQQEICQLARRNEEHSPVAYDIAMRIIMWGRWLKYSSEYPVYWRRFFRRDCAQYQQRGHADTVNVTGPVKRTRNDLLHHDRKGISDWLAKHNKYTTEEAHYAIHELKHVPYYKIFSRDRLQRRRAIKRVFRATPCNSLIRFLYLYILRFGFLDGVSGYEFCRLRSQQHFLVQLKIKELRNQEKSDLNLQASNRSTIPVHPV